ncbi:MAG TPA: hypothetical protein VG816_09575 [Solirubrobacterales bacterium]|nr:hypothetical protein [Solirubrobacterales bacterium]
MVSTFDLATDLGVKQVLRESPYIDYDYRSEFSQHFSRRFRPPPDRSERLIFLTDSVSAAGYCVMRPTAKPVGRTVMNIPDSLKPYVTCHAKQDILAYGRRFHVDGFPFMSQDGEYGRCAHAAIWSIARFQHATHKTGRHSIAAIVAATGTSQLPDRTAMSGGLTVAEVRQALRRLGLPVLTYTPARKLRDTAFAEVMCRYLDSGFPIAINTPGHLTVLVGYGRESDGTIRWIRCDDNHGPYELVPRFDPTQEAEPELGEWRAALVALPGRIHVPAESAQAAAEITFEKLLGATGGPKHLRTRWNEEGIKGRTYAVKPAELKEELFKAGPVENIAEFYLGVPAPVWAWITEFRDLDEDGRVLGTVMIDATSSKHGPEPVVADIDGWCVYFDPTDGPKGGQIVPSPVRYESRLPDRSWPSA